MPYSPEVLLPDHFSVHSALGFFFLHASKVIFKNKIPLIFPCREILKGFETAKIKATEVQSQLGSVSRINIYFAGRRCL